MARGLPFGSDLRFGDYLTALCPGASGIVETEVSDPPQALTLSWSEGIRIINGEKAGKGGRSRPTAPLDADYGDVSFKRIDDFGWGRLRCLESTR